MESDESAGYSYLVGKKLEELYQDVFEEIYPQIATQRKGVLSTVIHIILYPEESQAKKICQKCEIYHNDLNDDLSISLDIIGLFTIEPNDKNNLKNKINRIVKEGVKSGRKSFVSNWESEQMKLYQIVVIGCLIVGVIACITYLATKQKKLEIEKEDKTPPPKPKIPKPVALCLVIPASVVRNIIKNNPINISDVEELIDNTLYLLCTNPQDADANQQHLELVNEDIANASENTEVYVRINISDGEEMIGQKIPYILKKKLPLHGQYIVTELACLKYLSNSGLENFNRI